MSRIILSTNKTNYKSSYNNYHNDQLMLKASYFQRTVAEEMWNYFQLDTYY